MSSKAATGGGRRQTPPPRGEVREVRMDRRGIELIVRLENPADRAVHVIADVRTLHYDSTNHKLTVGLSDDGREITPGLAMMLPRFRHIDPHGEIELQLRVPARIVRLAPGPGAEGPVQFEEQDPKEATEVVVEVAWSDVPFYEDPRTRSTQGIPTEAWALGRARITSPMPGSAETSS